MTSLLSTPEPKKYTQTLNTTSEVERKSPSVDTGRNLLSTPENSQRVTGVEHSPIYDSISISRDIVNNDDISRRLFEDEDVIQEQQQEHDEIVGQDIEQPEQDNIQQIQDQLNLEETDSEYLRSEYHRFIQTITPLEFRNIPYLRSDNDYETTMIFIDVIQNNRQDLLLVLAELYNKHNIYTPGTRYLDKYYDNNLPLETAIENNNQEIINILIDKFGINPFVGTPKIWAIRGAMAKDNYQLFVKLFEHKDFKESILLEYEDSIVYNNFVDLFTKISSQTSITNKKPFYDYIYSRFKHLFTEETIKQIFVNNNGYGISIEDTDTTSYNILRYICRYTKLQAFFDKHVETILLNGFVGIFYGEDTPLSDKLFFIVKYLALNTTSDIVKKTLLDVISYKYTIVDTILKQNIITKVVSQFTVTQATDIKEYKIHQDILDNLYFVFDIYDITQETINDMISSAKSSDSIIEYVKSVIEPTLTTAKRLIVECMKNILYRYDMFYLVDYINNIEEPIKRTTIQTVLSQSITRLWLYDNEMMYVKRYIENEDDYQTLQEEYIKVIEKLLPMYDVKLYTEFSKSGIKEKLVKDTLRLVLMLGGEE